MRTITHALLGFVAGTALLALIAVTTSCAGTKVALHAAPKPVHVPRVAYYARFNDKDCKRIGKENPPRFVCKHVLLDPKEIDATGRK
jgi:hypothetical protein